MARVQLKPRVERGVELLDTVAPGWQSKIDADTLNLEQTGHCILGQLYETYAAGKKELGLSPKMAHYFGFTLSKDEMTEGRWRVLTSLWRMRVRYLQVAA